MDDPRTPADQPPAVQDAGSGPSPEPEVAAAAAEAGEAATAAPTETAAATAATTPAKRRSPFYLRGRHIRLPRSRRGIFALLLVLGAFGFGGMFGTVSLISWTETADFCGRCHTMSPELAAFEAGPHREVACAECHVEPGIAGWVKAKINGTRQLVEVVLGTFPEPIPPPEHSDLPKASDTCARCHSVERQALAALKTRTQFSEDEANTRQFVGLLVRPGGGDVFDVNRSVHWHVLRTVTFYSPDPRDSKIDYVAATTETGAIEEFISLNKVHVADDVQPDIDAIKATERATVMTCYDCHNRAGHSIGNPRIGIDYQLQNGGIDNTLPFIKREGMRVLVAGYPNFETADAAADKLASFYQTRYPEVFKLKASAIEQAIAEIKVLYRETATPEMKVSARTYPDHLGHMDFPGCFRCHDGGHVLVKDGVAQKRTIPSTCDTCHTFPQIGPAVASLPLGEPPTTHDDNLWVFNHRTVASSVEPGNQSCGECHARDYCVNCHSTGAVTVNHEEMATNHAAIIRKQGNTACAYCHQPVYCARCHVEPVLPVTTPYFQPAQTGLVAPDATVVRWPLYVKPGG